MITTTTRHGKDWFINDKEDYLCVSVHDSTTHKQLGFFRLAEGHLALRWTNERLIDYLNVKLDCNELIQKFKHGEMNGTDAGIKESLAQALKNENSDVAQAYMAELWLRGISKEDFINWLGQ